MKGANDWTEGGAGTKEGARTKGGVGTEGGALGLPFWPGVLFQPGVGSHSVPDPDSHHSLAESEFSSEGVM